GFSIFYTSGTAASAAAQTGPVGQEHLDAFEIGSKNRFFDRRLTLNGAVFYYLFDGKQERLSLVDNSTTPPVITSRFLNVGKAELYGGEIEATFSPNEHWDFSVGAGLLHTEITDSSVIIPAPRFAQLGNVSLE